ncbi:pseudouridine synthase [Ornithinimicrobium avium]|uniref:Pseudouridine synthase n=1 Tax=Ornithinimicrobium avium TaxID=2283195 RepID=A0A345NJR5_9MICO|nr:pseudouridine synthase [Ornithinimicrobium avium]AXH95273.1 rRNA pseudouridine synthase [Ornithinimicrobium avium]
MNDRQRSGSGGTGRGGSGGGSGRGRGGGKGSPPGGGRGRPRRSPQDGGGAGPRRAGKGSPPRRRPRTPAPTTPVDVHDPEGVRLQKLLAGAGFGSRRACEKLIEQGRVEVDGTVVTEMGVRVDPARQVVRVDGDRVVVDTDKVYLAFNKPAGVVSTMQDDEGRPSLADYVGHLSTRLFHVGRLDFDTEGLLLLTNDGELSHRLQHPAYGVPKTYVAQVHGVVGKDVGKRLRAGVELEDGLAKVDSFKLVDSLPGHSIVEVVLHEGRKHIVRRMLDDVGYPVELLSRTQVGPVHLGELRPGRYRALAAEEVAQLYRAAGL